MRSPSLLITIAPVLVAPLLMGGCGGNTNSPAGANGSAFASDLGTSAPRATPVAAKSAELGENGSLNGGGVGAIDGPWRRMVDKLPGKDPLPGDLGLTLAFGKTKGDTYTVTGSPIGKKEAKRVTIDAPKGSFAEAVHLPEKPSDPLLVFDRDTSRVVEASGVTIKAGAWSAASVARFDLRSGGSAGTPITAAKVSLFASLVRADEALKTKEIGHALGFVHPLVGKEGGVAAGSRYRLRGDFDDKTFSPAATAIVLALKRFGAVALDAAPAFALKGTKDAAWVDEDLAPLATIRTSDFVLVSEFGKEPKPVASRGKAKTLKPEAVKAVTKAALTLGR